MYKTEDESVRVEKHDPLVLAIVSYNPNPNMVEAHRSYCQWNVDRTSTNAILTREIGHARILICR